MVLDELFGNLLPQKIRTDLPVMISEDISALYNNFYALQFEKYHLNESEKVRSNISLDVLSKVVSSNDVSTDIQALATQDAMSKLNDLREGLLYDTSEKNKLIDSRMIEINNKIANYCISQLQSTDFKAELTITLFCELEEGKLEFNIPTELRVPMFYLFNGMPPSLNLADKEIYRSLYKFAPQEVKDGFTSQKPKYVSEDEKDYPATSHFVPYSNSKRGRWSTIPSSTHVAGAKGLNEKLKNDYANLMKRYLSKIIGIELPASDNLKEYKDKFTIPIGIRQEPNRNNYNGDTLVTTLDILLYEENKGILYPQDYTTEKKELEGLDFRYDKPKIKTISFLDMKEIENTRSQVLTEAAANIISAFARFGIQNKLQYKEVVLPIKNPHRR